MSTTSPPAVPLPHYCSANAPQFDPCNHSTLEVYLADYELAAEAAHLTLAKNYHNLPTTWGSKRKRTGKACLNSMPQHPDWDAFKEALLRD